MGKLEVEEDKGGNRSTRRRDATGTGTFRQEQIGWPALLQTEEEREADVAARSPWTETKQPERKKNFLLADTPTWTRGGKFGPPSLAGGRARLAKKSKRSTRNQVKKHTAMCTPLEVEENKLVRKKPRGQKAEETMDAGGKERKEKREKRGAVSLTESGSRATAKGKLVCKKPH